MIELVQVARRWPGPPPRPLFDGVSLTVARGELVAIVGESGSGKSTLLNLIAGLDTPDRGRVLVDGADLARLDDDARTRLRRERLGFVFQAFHVLPYLTVGQNVALPLALAGIGDTGTRVHAALAAVGLADRAHSRPRELSGGELQRVAIARALVHEPAVVLADEPTGNLDPRTAGGVFEALLKLVRAEGLAALIATHNFDLAAKMDRALELRDGRLVESAKSPA